MIFKPSYLNELLGELAIIPDGGITNIGGTNSDTFTVGGRGLLFSDGTSTDGSPVTLVTDLQSVYDNSTPTQINLSLGSDFVIEALNGNQFIIDADTGLVTVVGDLFVGGTITGDVSAAVNTDRVEIHQSAAGYTPFIMEPLFGIVPDQNVVDIKVTFGGPTVFSIDESGVTTIANLTVPGTINGVNLVQFLADFSDHIDPLSASFKHPAAQISVISTGFANITGTSVQDALQSIDAELGLRGDVFGFRYTQATPSAAWTIIHGGNTQNVQISVWDMDNNIIIPDAINIMNNNTVVILFGTAMIGRAILMLFRD